MSESIELTAWLEIQLKGQPTRDELLRWAESHAQPGNNRVVSMLTRCLGSGRVELSQRHALASWEELLAWWEKARGKEKGVRLDKLVRSGASTTELALAMERQSTRGARLDKSADTSVAPRPCTFADGACLAAQYPALVEYYQQIVVAAPINGIGCQLIIGWDGQPVLWLREAQPDPNSGPLFYRFETVLFALPPPAR